MNVAAQGTAPCYQQGQSAVPEAPGSDLGCLDQAQGLAWAMVPWPGVQCSAELSVAESGERRGESPKVTAWGATLPGSLG